MHTHTGTAKLSPLESLLTKNNKTSGVVSCPCVLMNNRQTCGKTKRVDSDRSPHLSAASCILQMSATLISCARVVPDTKAVVAGAAHMKIQASSSCVRVLDFCGVLDENIRAEITCTRVTDASYCLLSSTWLVLCHHTQPLLVSRLSA
ncbi:unnamed protein product [Amoebophrya sp. A120]|nr:unnamed protein product [Amoebophrya sp. A120]|eukprot:GSA120T00022794001.1